MVLLTSAGTTGRGGPPDPGLGRSVEGLLRAPGKEGSARVGQPTPAPPGIPPGSPWNRRESPRPLSYDLSPPPILGLGLLPINAFPIAEVKS